MLYILSLGSSFLQVILAHFVSSANSSRSWQKRGLRNLSHPRGNCRFSSWCWRSSCGREVCAWRTEDEAALRAWSRGKEAAARFPHAPPLLLPSHSSACICVCHTCFPAHLRAEAGRANAVCDLSPSESNPWSALSPHITTPKEGKSRTKASSHPKGWVKQLLLGDNVHFCEEQLWKWLHVFYQ